jgi:large subunit ribosomal protein L17
MRHRNTGRKLGRKSAQRTALRRHIVCALFRIGRIETTLAKAKEFRPWAEKMITIAKRGAAASAKGDKVTHLNAYRRLLSELHDESVVVHVIGSVAPKFADRPGGYTRVLRNAMPRLGDRAPTAIFELVGFDAEADAASKAAARSALMAKRKARGEAPAQTEA